MLKIYQGADLKKLAFAVLERSTKDAYDLDPMAAAWLLSDEAGIYADLVKLPDGTLGELASLALERLVK